MTTELPSGLVTFVFTDIEASTRLLKVLDEAAASMFDAHDAMMREVIDEHRGVEVNLEGDSFFMAFQDPSDAFAACVDAQRRLAATDWPGGVDVRVRMGIHSGLAVPHRDNYVSLAVHQAVRVMSAAHGGQVLSTDATAALATLDDDVALTPLGTFRLRDFDDPTPLVRVDAADLTPNTTAIRATPALQHNVVAPVTSFVDREADIAAVTELTGPGRITTIAGPGGVGKTRVAKAIGIEQAPQWADGVWMVDLAEIVEPELVAEQVAGAVGAAQSGGESRWAEVLSHLEARHAVLILDNIEHHIDTCADLLPDLLRTCPDVAVLATGREPLNIPGETVYRLAPLPVDGAGPAIDLFVDRARAADPALDPSREDLEAIAGICAHLDGLPLAIEIAAARVGVMRIDDILEGLSNRFRLLQSRDRSLPARQRTMEGLLGWSYRLLADREKTAFRRLAVFSGDFGIDAAIATVAGDGIAEDDVPELVWALVDKSLLVNDFTQPSTRYRYPESVQHYAMRLLIDNDEPTDIAGAAADFMLDRIAPWQVPDRRWLNDASLELANLRGLVDLVGPADPEAAQQLMCTVGLFHTSLQSFRTGIEELTRAIDLVPQATPTRVALMATLADLHLRQNDTSTARELLEEAKRVAAEVGVASWADVAIERTEGEIAVREGDFDAAIAIAEKALDTERSEVGMARMFNLLGVARASLGETPQAREAFERELQAYESLNLEANIASAQGNLAEIAFRSGEHEQAARHQRACLDLAMAIGQPVMIAYSLIGAAQLAEVDTKWSLAIRLRAAGERLLADAGHELHAIDLSARTSALAIAERAVGADSVAAALDNGRSLSVMDATELASEVLSTVSGG